MLHDSSVIKILTKAKAYCIKRWWGMRNTELYNFIRNRKRRNSAGKNVELVEQCFTTPAHSQYLIYYCTYKALSKLLRN